MMSVQSVAQTFRIWCSTGGGGYRKRDMRVLPAGSTGLAAAVISRENTLPDESAIEKTCL
jgi:hypothetical protein